MIHVQEGQNIPEQEIARRFHQCGAWGIASSIDLFNCNSHSIRSEERVYTFSKALCSFLQMRTFGPCTVVRFGDDPRVSGLSMVQLIETSLVSAHFIEQTDSACIDVFSCALYSPSAAAEFCRDFFEAQRVAVTFTYRGVPPGAL